MDANWMVKFKARQDAICAEAAIERAEAEARWALEQAAKFDPTKDLPGQFVPWVHA